VFGDWAVFWAAMVIFLVFPMGVIGYAWWVGSQVEVINDMDQIGSMDVDQNLKRFKDQ
jgi:hypothetical protein